MLVNVFESKINLISKDQQLNRFVFMILMNKTMFPYIFYCYCNLFYIMFNILLYICCEE